MWNIGIAQRITREGKLKVKKSEETNHERLWTPGTTLRVTEGAGGEKMG